MINFVKKYRVHIAVLMVSMIVGGVTSVKLGQDINFDLLNYHYHNPYSFLEGRLEHDIAVGELESYANPLPDIPGYLLIDNFSPKKAATALGVLQGFNIFFIFEITLVLMSRVKAKNGLKIVGALFIGIMSFFGAASLSEVGSTMGDNLVGILVLAGLWLLLVSFKESKTRFSPRVIRFMAFFLVGSAAGLKLTNAIYVVALLFAGLVVEGSLKQKIKESSLHVVAATVGLLATGGFWFIKMWSLFKNPVFPFFNGIFQSEYYPNVNFVDVRWIPKSIWRALFAPFYYTREQTISSEIPFRDPRLAVVYCLLVALVIYFLVRKFIFKKATLPKHWSKQHTVFWVFMIVSYLVWVSKFSYYRYLLPVELLGLVAIAVALYVLIPQFKYATFVLAAVVITITRLTIPIDWGRVPWQATYFGVSDATFSALKDSTVLIAGFAPLGFTVPYFPESTQTIRIESDLSSPSIGTSAMQGKIRRAVDNNKQEGSKFYALRADEEAVMAEMAFNHFGFKTYGCQELPVHVRSASQFKFRLCRLEVLN